MPVTEYRERTRVPLYRSKYLLRSTPHPCWDSPVGMHDARPRGLGQLCALLLHLPCYGKLVMSYQLVNSESGSVLFVSVSQDCPNSRNASNTLLVPVDQTRQPINRCANEPAKKQDNTRELGTSARPSATGGASRGRTPSGRTGLHDARRGIPMHRC